MGFKSFFPFLRATCCPLVGSPAAGTLLPWHSPEPRGTASTNRAGNPGSCALPAPRGPPASCRPPQPMPRYHSSPNPQKSPWAPAQYARQAWTLRRVWGRVEALASHMKMCQGTCPQHPYARPASASHFTSPSLHVETHPAGTESYGPLLATPRANVKLDVFRAGTGICNVLISALLHPSHTTALAEGLSGLAKEDSNACSVKRSVPRAELPSSTEWSCCSQHGWAFSGFYFCKFAERISTYRSLGAIVMLCKPDRPLEHFSACPAFNNWYLSASPHSPSHQHYITNSKLGATQIHEQGCVTDRLVCWTQRCWIPSFLECFLKFHIKPQNNHDLSYPKLLSMPGFYSRQHL